MKELKNIIKFYKEKGIQLFINLDENKILDDYSKLKYLFRGNLKDQSISNILSLLELNQGSVANLENS